MVITSPVLPATSLAQLSFDETHVESKPPPTLRLVDIPPIFVLPTRLSPSELQGLEKKVTDLGAFLTQSATKANIFLGKVGTKRRAEFELRCHGLLTEDVTDQARAENEETSRKRRRLETLRDISTKTVIMIDDSSTESENEVRPFSPKPSIQGDSSPIQPPSGASDERILDEVWAKDDSVKVVSIDWLQDSMEANELLPLQSYIVYIGRPKERPRSTTPTQLVDRGGSRAPSSSPVPSQVTAALQSNTAQAILARAKADAHTSRKRTRPGAKPFFPGFYPHNRRSGGSPGREDSITRPTKLIHQTTSEFEEVEATQLPEMPTWVKEKKKYACERSTPKGSPNMPFIEELKKIKLSRILTKDDIGVRAYSTSIAAIAAYPREIKSTAEILALPGCDIKIAHLFHEWKENGKIQIVEDVENDPASKVLRLFYEIWGVGATTARHFYYGRGWRDLDDIVEEGWNDLTRVQQIGLKYYDEFQVKLPREEVESIADIITRHARLVRDNGIECCIVGGYRRGKDESGDVDVILSHRDEMQTLGLVRDVVASLELEGWITHTLLLAMSGTRRNQMPVQARELGGGHGFDTLDKALVVWQDIHFDSEDSSQKKVKNPNIHRRVDIIIAPWSTVGCAIIGWSGANTFERDLRRYAKNVKGWKFDSSGVRDRATDEVIDLELDSEGEEAPTWQEAEKRVFKGFGLQWREPWERWTE